jgi:hypothetical protein
MLPRDHVHDGEEHCDHCDELRGIHRGEHSAAWLPGCLTALDACQRAFARHDPNIHQDEPLSLQVCRALTVVPFVFEQVGDLIDRVDPGVIAFGTDHPHSEG